MEEEKEEEQEEQKEEEQKEKRRKWGGAQRRLESSRKALLSFFALSRLCSSVQIVGIGTKQTLSADTSPAQCMLKASCLENAHPGKVVFFGLLPASSSESSHNH